MQTNFANLTPDKNQTVKASREYHINQTRVAVEREKHVVMGAFCPRMKVRRGRETHQRYSRSGSRDGALPLLPPAMAAPSALDTLWDLF
ncbi:hypothetical protein E2C01_028723 [Portunus trituberculatus]|uniref:Uncharacterized protein n=1 Tax=Portunus trituberculatus TaxID=210409 RepID=A0A5B7ELE7_PORTR|nr:hypothetical protein [Portunus trituberculatus]